MPLSGPVVHQQLLKGYADVQSRLQSLHQQDKQTASRHQALGADRDNALTRLAEHYLPDLTEDSIKKTWSEARPALIDVLRRKEDARQKLESQLQSANEKHDESNQRIIDVNYSLDQVNEVVDELSEKVELELTKDVDFIRLSEAAARAEAGLERAEANLDEIEQDAAAKLPAYEDSDLFQYLWERGFGTDQYSSRGFTRRTDRWLSRLIGYPKAVQSYQFLKETPQTMQKIIADDRAALQTVMSELTRIRNETADRIGLTSKVAESDLISKKRADLLDQAKKHHSEVESLNESITELDDARGPYYREAIVAFRSMLGMFDSDDLKSYANSTREITDDQIAASLSAVDATTDELEARSIQHRRDVRLAQDLLGGLGRLIQRFRDAKYESSRSQFLDSVDIQHRIFNARDASDLEDLWTAIRRAHRWGPSTMDRITEVATHPMTQVLVNAMAHAAGGALRDHARRAGRRRF